MSTIEEYPKYSYFLVANGSSLELGSYEPASDGDLSIAQLRIFHKCLVSFDYNLRLVVSSRQFGPVLVASDWLEFSNETTGQTSSDWLGDIVFDFPSYKLSAGEIYYVRIEITGYSRPVRPNQNTAYLSVWTDWLQPIGLSNTAGARIALGVKR